MNESHYIIESCEGLRPRKISPTLPISEGADQMVKCGARFETHEATGKCPQCGTPFEIQHQGKPVEVNP